MVTVLLGSRTVPPRATSWYALAVARPFRAWTARMAAVRVVFPWSMCPMVPTLTWTFLMGVEIPRPRVRPNGVGRPFRPTAVRRPFYHDERIQGGCRRCRAQGHAGPGRGSSGNVIPLQTHTPPCNDIPFFATTVQYSRNDTSVLRRAGVAQGTAKRRPWAGVGNRFAVARGDRGGLVTPKGLPT